jgi:D-lyxose ketol-isomerase
MKRSQINEIYREAAACFERHGWTLPPEPRWDITDFGLNDFDRYGLVLINLAEEAEYCEKLMYARVGQTTPLHTHAQKKEDIICRHGALVLELWAGHPDRTTRGESFSVRVNGASRQLLSGETLTLPAGERITLTPGIYHAFWAGAPDSIIGEVSTANDDSNDNFFVNPDVGRFPEVEEDEPAIICLLSDR